MKITLIGPMGIFADRGACIVGVMVHTGELHGIEVDMNDLPDQVLMIAVELVEE